VQALVDMGFEQDHAMAVLVDSKGDLSEAVSRLLELPSSPEEQAEHANSSPQQTELAEAEGEENYGEDDALRQAIELSRAAEEERRLKERLLEAEFEAVLADSLRTDLPLTEAGIPAADEEVLVPPVPPEAQRRSPSPEPTRLQGSASTPALLTHKSQQPAQRPPSMNGQRPPSSAGIGSTLSSSSVSRPPSSGAIGIVGRPPSSGVHRPQSSAKVGGRPDDPLTPVGVDDLDSWLTGSGSASGKRRSPAAAETSSGALKDYKAPGFAHRHKLPALAHYPDLQRCCTPPATGKHGHLNLGSSCVSRSASSTGSTTDTRLQSSSSQGGLHSSSSTPLLAAAGASFIAR